MINRGDLGGMSRQTGITEQFFSSRLGNTVDLQWKGPDRLPFSNDPQALPQDGQLILEADLSGTQPGLAWTAGAWVLTIDAFAEWTSPPTGTEDTIIPVRASVSIGTGGSSQTFDVDVRNNSFQLPGANVRVVVNWDETVPASPAFFTRRWRLPQRVRVVAQLQRGFSSNPAKRTLWLPTGWQGQPVAGKIPNFARCARVLGNRVTLDPYFQDSQTFLSFYTEDSANGINLLAARGTNLVNPSGIPVPNMAQNWYLFGPPFGSPLAPRMPPALEFDVLL